MNSPHYERAQILFNQSRFDLAEQELKQALSTNPENAYAYALLAMCQAEQNQPKEALQNAQNAIGLAPDEPGVHYALATVYLDMDRPTDAETSIHEALRLDPYMPTYFATLSSALLQQKKWKEALEAAEQGLALDPEHVPSANFRAYALTQLGRKAEADETLDAALAHDPENASTHANQGWLLLRQNKRERALDHFREALRLDPTLNWAREGIVESLKAGNPIYRVFLYYFFLMSRLSQKAQWGVIIGLYILFRLLRGYSESNPAIEPYVTPILILYVVFMLLTWTADPLFNLLLRINRHGRLALSDEQMTASNWVGGVLLATTIPFSFWLTTDEMNWLIISLCWGAMIVPISSIFKPETPKGRHILMLYSAGLGLIATLIFVSMIFPIPFVSALFTIFVVGWILFSWIANAVIMKW